MGQDNAVVDELWPVDAVAEVVGQRLNLGDDEAREIAEKLGALFGAEDRIDDAGLERKERALLWRLLQEGIVTTGLEVRPHPEHGRPWRYYHWDLVPPERLLAAVDEAGSQSKVPPEIQVYEALPADTWSRNRATAG